MFFCNIGLNDILNSFSCSFTEKWIPNVIISHRYKAQDTPARRTFEQALTGAFMSAVIKDLRPSALPFVASLIRHYTMVAVAQQCGMYDPIFPELSFTFKVQAQKLQRWHLCILDLGSATNA